jgi:predicted DNA-binding transcriptional regulator AlpA
MNMQANFNSSEPEVLTFSALLTLLGRRSRQSIYDLMRRDPSFPKPRQIGMSRLIAPVGAWAPASCCVQAIRDGGYAAARLETNPNAATFYLHRGYLPSGARTADGALPLSKRLSEHEPKPPLQSTTSAGG